MLIKYFVDLNIILQNNLSNLSINIKDSIAIALCTDSPYD